MEISLFVCKEKIVIRVEQKKFLSDSGLTAQISEIRSGEDRNCSGIGGNRSGGGKIRSGSHENCSGQGDIRSVATKTARLKDNVIDRKRAVSITRPLFFLSKF